MVSRDISLRVYPLAEPGAHGCVRDGSALGAAPGVFAALLTFMLAVGCAGEPAARSTSAPPPAPAPARAPAAVSILSGPFELREALAFYFVNPAGGDFTIHLRWRDPYQPQMDRPLLVRVFDPNERLLLRHDEPGVRVNGDAPEHVIDLPIKANGSGVYQVAVTAFGGTLELFTEPRLSFGVFGYPSLIGHKNQFDNTFVFLPTRLDSMTVRCSGTVDDLSLVDETGAVKISGRGANPGGQTALPINGGEYVWKLSIYSQGDYQLNFAGLPIILCPDESTARAIHASVDVLSDGTICFHKFQVRAHEILNRFRSMPPSAYAVHPPILIRYKSQWLADPERNQLLVGPYGVYSALNAVLAEQNLDGASPWFGSIHVWRDFAKQNPVPNPWASYTRLGLVRVAAHVSILGAVYSINQPFNPLYHVESLRNRIIIASLDELMMLREHESPQTEFPDYDGGDRAFTFASFTHTFPWVVRDCPQDVRDVWTEGLARYVDRETISQVADPVNQWTFLMKGIQHYADGVDDPWYRDIVKRHIGWLLTRNQWNFGRQPAGYFNEGEGPDATYNGLSGENLAWLCKQTNNKELLAALRQFLNLFNHTVAPEPNGMWMGASSFCHRTPGDWSAPQHGAGLAILADVAPEAAVGLNRAWNLAAPTRSAVQLQAAEQKLLGQLVYMEPAAFTSPTIGPQVLSDSAEISFAVWEHFASAVSESKLPVVAENTFTRNFGDEFFCVRHPAYYAFLYAGHPMGEWQRGRWSRDPHQQSPHNGGGLCLFWSPALGTSILGKNWSAYTSHSLIAERIDGGADWEDYWSIRSTFDEAGAVATIKGALRDLPITFTKVYQFKNDRIACDLSLHADQPVNCKTMSECFPYPLDKPDTLRVSLLDTRGGVIGNDQPASAILLANGSAEAHVIVFAQPRRCSVGVEHSVDAYNHQREYGRVLAELPSHWSAGQDFRATWAILPVPANQVGSRVQQVVRDLAAGN